jgi:hypothetical protein
MRHRIIVARMSHHNIAVSMRHRIIVARMSHHNIAVRTRHRIIVARMRNYIIIVRMMHRIIALIANSIIIPIVMNLVNMVTSICQHLFSSLPIGEQPPEVTMIIVVREVRDGARLQTILPETQQGNLAMSIPVLGFGGLSLIWRREASG